MVDAIISFAFQTLGDMLVQEVKFLAGVEDKAKQLHDELRWMMGFLREVDEKHGDNQRVRTCVEDMKEVAFKVEGIIETFALEILSKRRPSSSAGEAVLNFARRFVCLFKEASLLHGLGERIDGIIGEINGLTMKMQTYGINRLTTGEGSSSSFNERRKELLRTYSHKQELVVVGLDEDIRKLVDLLVVEPDRPPHPYRVVFVHGMGGLGKTTLARKVYNDGRVKAHFECLAWAYISEKFDTRDVLEGILLKLMSAGEDSSKMKVIGKMKPDQLVKKLCEIQKEKKCLIVLDDMWSGEAWQRLSAAFPNEETGSRIIVTSRVKRVTDAIDLEFLRHEPCLLDEDKSWELFEKTITSRNHKTDFTINSSMKVLGNEMVKYCSGLPLAITVVGRLLAEKYTLGEWKTIRDNIRSYVMSSTPIHEGKDYVGVLKILSLSYDYLPYDMKPCFLHLSNFPEDHSIPARALINRWIAEGLVPKKGGELFRQEDEAYMILNELVDRHMIQVERRDIDGTITHCRMLDLMREMCVEKAKAESLLLDVDNQPGGTPGAIESSSLATSPMEETSSRSIRRLALHIRGETTESKLLDISELKENKRSHHNLVVLRSLIFFRIGEQRTLSEENISYIWRNLRLLRVLDFRGVEFPIERLSKQVGDLVHLRYLNFRGTRVREFPPSLGELESLIHLDLFTLAEAVTVPDVLWKMTKLRYLQLPGDLHENNPKLRLANLRNLQELLFFDTVKCDVRDLFKLYLNLRVLWFRKGSLIEFGELCAERPGFTFPHLHALHLNSGLYDAQVLVDLKKVLPTSPNLSKAVIVMRTQSGLPMELPLACQNLISLKFRNCEFSKDPMPVLEKLPNLKELYMSEKSYLGDKMKCTQHGFPNLRVMILKGLQSLEEWQMQPGAIPKLQWMQIQSCKSLKKLPEAMGSMSWLAQLVFRDMPADLTDKYKQGGEHFHVVNHVPSISITN